MIDAASGTPAIAVLQANSLARPFAVLPAVG